MIPGLTAAEVAEQRRLGLINVSVEQSSRTVGEILKANALTRFNALLGAMLVVILIVGPIQDAMFGLILIFNTGIGTVQEWRAKRSLDKLAIVTTPLVRVVRDGITASVPPTDVVLGDVIDIQPGDQIVVDGDVLVATGLEVDESLLTGESEPVRKESDTKVMSGSFVAAGSGLMRTTRVGAEAYAATLNAEAKRFTAVRSELRDGINRMLRVITWVLVPVAGLLVWSQLAHNHDFHDAIRGSVAGTVTMVPEGLVLLTSIAFAVGAVRLARQRVLVRELPALEGLARVDVLCIDKTGTLTTGKLGFESVRTIDVGEPADIAARVALGALVASDSSPNATVRAIGDVMPVRDEGWQPAQRVAFSSSRKYSGTDFGAHGVWLLGAPDVLLAGVQDTVGQGAAAIVNGIVRDGRRAVLLARAERLPADADLATCGRIEPVAVIALRDVLRPDAAKTLAYLSSQDIRVKVISGDHPTTVGSIAAQLGLSAQGTNVDATTLPKTDSPEFRQAVEDNDIFGRVTPHQKQAMVAALQANGHTVAMTGDGVNDVLALKAADLGIAMGSAAPAARAVAQLVLLDDAFSAVPAVVAEGRRVIANIERVANLFLTKTVYATVLALVVGVARLPFPFLPRHLTLVSALTIGIPAFFLALAPNAQRARPGFIGRVLRFAAPAGLVAAAATFGAYSLARSETSTSLAAARTIATYVLAGVALWILSILARPATRAHQWLIASMVALLAASLAVPWARTFFALTLPRPVLGLAGVGVAALAGLALEAGWLAAGSTTAIASAGADRLAARRVARLHAKDTGPFRDDVS